MQSYFTVWYHRDVWTEKQKKIAEVILKHRTDDWYDFKPVSKKLPGIAKSSISDVAKYLKKNGWEIPGDGGGKGDGTGKGDGNGKGDGAGEPIRRPEQTKDIEQAVYVRVVPKEFRMDSGLIWQAMEAAINEWHWPRDISPKEFIDAYLVLSFKQRGIVLGGYVVEEEEAPV